LQKRFIPGRKISHNQVYLTSVWSSVPTALFYMLLFALTLLAACSTPPPPVGTPPTVSIPLITPTGTKPVAVPTSTATVTVTPLPTSSFDLDQSGLNGIKIKFWHPWSGEIIPNLVAEFNAANEFGILVESVHQGNINSLNEHIADADPVADLPNLTVGSSDQISSWVAQGKPVVDLNPYLNDPQWGLSSDERADFYQLFLEQDLSAQNRIGFPASRSTHLMFYNTSWAKELGFTSAPGTPQEFMEQACEAAQANAADEDDGSGGWLINTNPSAVLSWIYAFGNPVVLPDGSGYQFNNPQTEQAVLFLKELFDQGCAWEVLETPPEVEFANRKALFITSSLTDLAYQSAELNRVDNSDEWTVLGFPSPQSEPVISVYGPSFVMFAGSPEENLAAWLFIEWLTSAEQQAEFVTAHGSFPTRASTIKFLSDFARDNPQWSKAQDLLAGALPEPNLDSWNVVRWVLGDVGTQIFRYYFTPDRVPATLELMDETVSELHERTQ
jgi:ABC-type glycerol-3-phosphate transport system substrate-binding protein